MKKLVIIRHAKAADPLAGMADFDRPLTDKGKADAEIMGLVLGNLGYQPDLIISSPARRTRQTAKRIARGTGYDENSILFPENMYHCTPSIIEQIVSALVPSVKTVIVVGHNPGITEFAHDLDPALRIGHLPTCGTVVTEVSTDLWSDFPAAPKKIIFFKHP